MHLVCTVEFVTREETKSPQSKSDLDWTKRRTHGEAGSHRLKWFDDWSQAHPCTEGVLPWDAFPRFMTDVVSELPGPVARKTRIMLGPFRGERFRRIMDAGGKRYLSGWLDFGRREWQQHYGDLWECMLECKREFDPRHILNPGGIPLSP